MNLSKDEEYNIVLKLASNPELLNEFKNKINKYKNILDNNQIDKNILNNNQIDKNVLISIKNDLNELKNNHKEIKILEPKEYKEIYHHVFTKKRNVFLTGIAGTGKSQSILCIKRDSDKKRIKCDITSTTGISAINIKGQTIHRFSGIKTGERPLDQILKNIAYTNKECIKRIKECELLVLDEVSLLGKRTFELLDKVFKHFRKNKLPFGGIQIILTGDFLQLPPINDDFCFESEIWDQLDLQVIIMDTPYRYKSIEHYKMLKRIRLGNPTKNDIKILQSRADTYKIYENITEHPIESISEFTRLNKDLSKIIYKYLDLLNIKPTRLFATKVNVNDYNMKELGELSTKEYTFKCKDDIEQKNESFDWYNDKIFKHYQEYMDTMVSNKIILKEKAQVILTKNLDVENGLSNGSRGVIVKIEISDDPTIKVLFLNGQIVDIKYEDFIQEDKNYIFTRKQIPLILGFAITIHKSQGMSIDRVIMDLGPSLFQEALAYVSLSRVKTLDGILITKLFSSKIKANVRALEFEKFIMNNK